LHIDHRSCEDRRKLLRVDNGFVCIAEAELKGRVPDLVSKRPLDALDGNLLQHHIDALRDVAHGVVLKLDVHEQTC
jgi:hypothetical protein